MTPQEVELLNSLVERVNQTPLQEKDPDAEALLNQSLGGNPDALYILAQTVLVQKIALEQAKTQVLQLQQQMQQARTQPAPTTSFLGRLLGDRDPEPAQQQPPPYQPVPNYGPPQPQYAQPQYQQSQYVPVPGGPMGYGYAQPSFLRGAMQTAAGVAAGALAFEGVEAVLHGLGRHGGYGWGEPGLGGFGGGGFGRPMEETVINNYYEEPGAHATERGGEHDVHDSASQFADKSGAQLSDAGYGDSGDNLRGFDLADTDTSADLDNTETDNSGVDDGAGFDDNGGFDDAGGFDGDGNIS